MCDRLRVGILTSNKKSWCANQLVKALRDRGASPTPLEFSNFSASISRESEGGGNYTDSLRKLDAIIVQTIGRESLEKIIFRIDVLHYLAKQGVVIINPPSAIEKAADKYHALMLLEEGGISVPRTIVTESWREAMEAFYNLGEDVVVKPLFGSQGVGVTRVTEPSIARKIFQSLEYNHHILYLQEFVEHGNEDIRAFVIGSQVIAAMQRVSNTWKTNISQGAQPVPRHLSPKLRKLAVRAAKVLGCEVAGVDILEGTNGPLISEVNGLPGWRGLQKVTKINIADEVVDYVLSKIR